MENEIIVRPERKPFTAKEILAQVQLIQEVMEAVMKKDIHYGIIPGTPKPTLYKPGAEKLLSTFHIGVDPREEIIDLSNDDEIRYRVLTKGFSQESGNLLGVGVGECSSSEEKYKWRKPVCEEEFNETAADRKRVAWKHGPGGKAYQQKQIRMNPIDVANTVLKMAKKRSLVDMTLTITAASDIFDQDLEDLPEGLEVGANGKTSKPPIQDPQKKGNGKPPETPSVTVAVDKVEIKTGSSKGKAWTLYIIHAGGEQYNTFSESFSKLAQKSFDDQINAVISWSQTEKGKKLENITLEEVLEPGSDEDAQD